jgi:hypothetical protein
MKEMKINLFMDAEKNIIVTNLNTNYSFTISCVEKTITAPQIYQLLNYQINNTYILDSNVESIGDENDKSYFFDIISLFKSITKEVSEIADTEETTDNQNDADENNA